MCRSGRREFPSVRGTPLNDPMLALTGDICNELEVRVIMKHDKVTSLGNRGDKTIDERDGSMLSSGRKCALYFNSPSMIGVSHRYRRKGCEAVGKLAVVGRGPGRVTEFKGHGWAHGDVSLCRQGCERRGDCGFRQASEHARIRQIPRPRHLCAVTSSLVCRIEVEASVLAEECDEFKSTFGVDNLSECGVDGVSESPRPEDRRRFTGDILVYINGCL